MAQNHKNKVSIPQFGNYNVLFEYFIKNGLETDYIRPPQITKHTLELGNKYSPDYVCTPFKFTLGCLLESIEKGANTLVQVGGIVACRLKYYGSLQEQIIKDLGHQVTFVNLGKADKSKPKTFIDLAKQINPKFSLFKVIRTGLTVVAMLGGLDKMQAYYTSHMGFEINSGDFDKVMNEYLDSLLLCKNNVFAVNRIFKKSIEKMEAIPVDMPKDPLRVAVIGEYYTVMDNFSSHDIEKKLAKYGMSVERWLNITNTVIKYNQIKRRKHTAEYIKYDMGVTTTSNVGFALDCAKAGYDGIIHLKSFGCTPEIDDMPVLRNISKDYNIPVLFFSFDCQTADAGIETRLEAFYDMLNYKKEAEKNKDGVII